jgi:TolB-like protein/Tfp pilus assembly protein PilF
MHALDAAGDRMAAINHASEHARRLREDLDLAPAPDVVALAERLRTAPARRPPQPAPGGPARSASVAVLPFLNLSADPGHEYFADGITDDVIAQLSKIRALKVVSHSSVITFKQRDRNLKEIARALGATTLLDGSVRHAGDRVRIVAKFVDAETEQHLWAETYDRQITDIFAIQTDVALRIAAALKAELTRDEHTRLTREPTSDVQAYKLYLQGRQWFIKYTPDALVRAIECFERAVARDPDFALAQATLAMAYIELAEHGAIAPDVAYRHALDAATTALRLDPDLGAAHCTLAHLKAVSEHDWAGAEREFERALELNPGNADAHDLYGRLCSALERHDDAIALLRRAQELDPLAHRADVATALLRAGRYVEAVASASDAVELDPSHDRARATLGWGYFLTGRQADGLAELEHAVAHAPDSTMWLAQLGEASAMAGDTDRARAILAELEHRARHAYVSPYHFAYVHTGLGETEQALACLERAVAERTGPAYNIKSSFLFKPLREHPRFRAILRQMHLA